MITDRDKYMSTKLKNNSSQVNVVVVGKAHMKGIKEKLEKRTDFSLDNLNEIRLLCQEFGQKNTNTFL